MSFPSPSLTARRPLPLLVIGYLALFFLLFWFIYRYARAELIDGDEGFYLLASKLILEGKVPYQDFFFPQAPLLPYLYAGWFKIVGLSWESGRALSCLFAAGTGTLLYFHVRNAARSHPQLLSLAAVLLFALSSFTTVWYTLVKTYSASAFFLFAAYVLISLTARNPWKFLGAGLLLGIAVDVRLYLIAALPVFLYVILRPGPDTLKQRLRHTLFFILGLSAGLLPLLYFFLLSPDRFMFNNLGYHSLRTPAGLIGSLDQKKVILLRLFGFSGVEGVISYQFAFLAILSSSYAASQAFLAKRIPTAFWIALFLSLALLLPTPTDIQYYAVLTPFLIVASLALFSTLGHEARTHLSKQRVSHLIIFATAAYGLASLWSFYGGGSPKSWSLESVQEVAQAVDRQTTNPGESVLSWWPGYFIETERATSFPGMENHFGLLVAHRLDDQQLARYHILSTPQIEAAIRSGQSRIVVVGNWITIEDARYFRELLPEAGYSLVETVGSAEIYRFSER